jgi:hypothetical protein
MDVTASAFLCFCFTAEDACCNFHLPRAISCLLLIHLVLTDETATSETEAFIDFASFEDHLILLYSVYVTV